MAKKILDFYYKIPNALKKGYIKSIEKIVERHKINIILVTSDEESLILSKHYQLSKVQVATSNYDTLKILSDKIKTYEILAKNKIRLPKWKPIKKKEILFHQSSILKDSKKIFVLNHRFNTKIFF